MNTGITTSSYSGSSLGSPAQVGRERGRGIEDILNDISMELHEGVNSSENLADKLLPLNRPPQPGEAKAACPDPSHVTFRLERVLQGVREINANLNRAHTAING